MRGLVLALNFAPRSASPAIRAVNLAVELARHCESLHVVTYEADHLLLYSPEDAELSRMERECPTLTVHRLRPGFFRRRIAQRALRKGHAGGEIKRRWNRSLVTSLFVPDSHFEVIGRLRREASRLIERFDLDFLVTFSYPYSVLLAGAAIKRRHPDVMWIADYGDPWTGNPVSEIPSGSLRRRLDAMLERRALARVDGLSVTTARTRQLMERSFPGLAGRVGVHRMGMRSADFARVTPHEIPHRRRFELAALGRLYPRARNASEFWKALFAAVREDRWFRDELRVWIVGSLEGEADPNLDELSSMGVVEVRGWVPTAQALGWMRGVDGLLLFGNKGGIQVPGKLYQYLGSRTPIVYLQEADEDEAAEIAGAAGAVVLPNRNAAIGSFLRSLRDGGEGTLSPHAGAGRGAEEYEWESIGAQLFAFLGAMRARATTLG